MNPASSLYDYQESFLIISAKTTERDGNYLLREWSKNLSPFQVLATKENETTLLRQLEGKGAPQLLSFEESESLELNLKSKTPIALQDLEISQFSLSIRLQIALAITQALAKIHHHDIFHLGLRPGVIYLSSDYQNVEIFDYSNAHHCPKSSPGVAAFHPLYADSHFLAPEQSYEYEKWVDNRSDLYALGCIFFWLFSGRSPFADYQQPKQLHYAHMAQAPDFKQFTSIRADIKQVLIEIISRLLAKHPDQRYQSGSGVIYDLNLILSNMDVTPLKVPVGSHDMSDRLLIPQRLYGRKQEVKTLLDAYERVSQGPSEALLIGGYSGVGKSALIQTVHKPILQSNGLFVSGKFDQYQRSTPYSAISQAFGNFIRYVLSLPENQLKQWHERLHHALYPNANILIDIIPELGQLLGPQPELHALGPEEEQNRFNRIFLQFVHEICTSHKPLAIFIDDLQWADLASIKLLRLLLSDPSSRYCLIFGAYRDNEVDERHPFMQMLNDLKEQPTQLTHIHLKPLAQSVIQQIIADTFRQSPTQVEQLTRIVYEKTGGNPFFFRQFLQELYQSELILFNLPEQRWEWSIATIEQQNITDNVVDLMLRRIDRLPSQTIKLLQYSACIGARIPLNIIQTLYPEKSDELQQALNSAFENNLLIPQGKYILDESTKTDTPTAKNPFTFRFLHDRVQQAAYSRLDTSTRTQIHYQIGHYLYQSMTQEQREEDCFELLAHFNQAQELVHGDMLSALSRLNLFAAEKAKAATAYNTAIEFIHQFFHLLESKPELKEATNNVEQADSELHAAMLKLECLYLAGEYEMAEQFLETVRVQCQSIADKVRLSTILITQYTRYGELNRAIKQGQETLKILHHPLPDEPQPVHIETAIDSARKALIEQPFPQLAERSTISQQKVLYQLDVLMAMQPCCYNSGSLLFPLTILGLLQLTLQHGNSSYSSYVYMMYALLCTKVIKDYETAFQATHYSDVIAQKFPANPLLEGRLLMMKSNFVLPWQFSLRQSSEIRQAAYNHCLEQGDYYWGIHAYVFGFYADLIATPNLDKLLHRTEQVITLSEQIKQPAQVYLSTLQANLLKILRGDLDNLQNLDHQPGYEVQALAYYQETHYMCGKYDRLLGRLMQGYLFGNYEQALEVSLSPQLQYNDLDEGIFHEAVYCQFNLLCILALRLQNKPLGRPVSVHYLQWYDSAWEKYQNWYQLNATNFAPIYHLITAEKAALEGLKMEAINHYEQAIASSEQSGYALYQALAYERYGLFRLDTAQQQNRICFAYWQQAKDLYQAWGSYANVAKIDALLKKYQSAIPLQPKYQASFDGSQSFDWQSVVSASQDISQPLTKDELIERMLLRVMTTTGAQQIGFYQRQQQSWHLRSICEQGEVSNHPPTPTLIPQSILNYCQHSHKMLVLTHAEQIGDYILDPYISHHHVQSVMAVPLLVREQLIGVFYLQHLQTANLFSPQKAQVMELLAAQFAISYQNASYYEQLQQHNKLLELTVEQRTKALSFENNRLQSVLEALPIPYVISQLDGTLLEGNDALFKLFELTPEQFKQVNAQDFYVNPEERAQILEELSRHGSMNDVEIQLRTYCGKEFWALFSAVQVELENNQEIFATISDISSRKEKEKNLRRQASTDPLTGIYNRRSFYQLAQSGKHRQSSKKYQIAMLDLDHFKQLNDQYGHAAGDEVLKKFTQHVKQQLRQPDIFGRLGGEEFAILLMGLEMHQAEPVLQRICRLTEQLQIPFKQSILQFTMSGGLTTWQHSESLDAALKRADELLYRAKHEGRNRIVSG